MILISLSSWFRLMAGNSTVSLDLNLQRTPIGQAPLLKKQAKTPEPGTGLLDGLESKNRLHAELLPGKLKLPKQARKVLLARPVLSLVRGAVRRVLAEQAPTGKQNQRNHGALKRSTSPNR